MALTSPRDTSPFFAGKPERVIASTVGLTIVGAVVILALAQPVPVFAALFAVPALILLIRYPIVALGVLLFLQPFNSGILTALSAKASIAPGALGFWAHGLIVALFIRSVAERRIKDRALPVRHAGDNLLLVYVIAWCAIAVFSPPRQTVAPALGRYVDGPLLILSLRFLRPTRTQLLWLAGAILAAAAIMGGAAIYEQLGPQSGFQRWYGAQPGPNGEPFRIGTSGYRAGSFLYDPLILGFYLAGAAPLALALVAPRTRRRIAAVVCFAACAGGLVAAATRSGYIGGALGVIAALGLVTRRGAVRLSLLGIAIIVAGSLTVIFIASGSENLVRSESDTSHRERVDRDIRLIVARPFGYGLGTTDRFISRSNAGEGQLGPTENTYLATALEGGIHGLLFYLIGLFAIVLRLRAARARSIRAGDALGTALAAGALGTIVGIAVPGLFIGTHELVVEALLWGVPGIALAWPANADA